MVAENKAGGRGIQWLAKLLSQAHAVARLGMFFKNAGPDEECSGFLGGIVLAKNPLGSFAVLTDKLFYGLPQ